MKLLAPEYLWLLFIAIPIIVLYFLKLKRTPRYVSSTLLWEKTIEDMRVNAPFQRLKRSLLLFIQLLILLFLTLALARPANDVEKSIGNRRIFLLDVSASMKTIEREFDKSRFEISRNKIREAIAGIKHDELIALITFDSRAHLASPFTAEKTKFLESLDRVKPTDNPTDISEALNLAESLSLKHENVEISIVSDGRFQPEEIPVRFNKMNLRFVRIGKEFDNVGISNLAARISPMSRSQYDLTITVFNAGNESAEGILEIKHEDKLIDAKKFSLGSGKDEFFTISDNRLSSGIVEANILRQDQFMLDNRATLILPKPRKVRILLISNGNDFLTGLLSVASSAFHEITVQAESVDVDNGLKLYNNAANNYDLVIFDMCSPERMKAGNHVFMGAVPPLSNWSLNIEELVDAPEPKPPTQHPLLNYIDFSNVFIKKAPKLKIPTSAKIIIDSEETPLVALYTQKGLKIVVFGFDVYDSTWPMQPSFPLLFNNIINYLTRTEEGHDKYVYRTGETCSIFAEVEDDSAKLMSPRGERKNVILGNDRYWHLGQLSESGVYKLSVGNESKMLAVSLLNFDESNISTRENLSFKGGSGTVRIEDLKSTREYWKYMLIFALLLILFEWYIYHRRPFG
ncbi:MAG: BatA and WFA domain-containing protein [Planctomycetes bacterium]|nr:BatA and WFA domain-containing protein [Planctomycetota bacterium]